MYRTIKSRILALALVIAALTAVGCGGNGNAATSPGGAPSSDNAATPAGDATPAPDGGNSDADTDFAGAVIVVSREDGSGTRGAFVELFGILDENKIDQTTLDAEITNSTSVMISSVAGSAEAIGYISLGSLSSAVKALKIDGAEPSVASIKNGSYAISRPFNLALTTELSAAAQDFVSFIMSAEGQSVIESGGYIKADEAAAPYSGGGIDAGRVVIAGSSSVTPIMDKLKDAYLAINPSAQLEIQQSDSSTGVAAAIDGICDIGMSSRALKDSELERGVYELTIATDGVAVIVSPNNPVDALTREQVRAIFTGEIQDWAQIR
ncbi:MAG: substrate-binding domain-containing protein [Oscillospiraceae bacterium]|nr:substrate-binding domain-containing protein [Oscillospiraceae bacterium]